MRFLVFWGFLMCKRRFSRGSATPPHNSQAGLSSARAHFWQPVLHGLLRNEWGCDSASPQVCLYTVPGNLLPLPANLVNPETLEASELVPWEKKETHASPGRNWTKPKRLLGLQQTGSPHSLQATGQIPVPTGGLQFHRLIDLVCNYFSLGQYFSSGPLAQYTLTGHLLGARPESGVGWGTGAWSLSSEGMEALVPEERTKARAQVGWDGGRFAKASRVHGSLAGRSEVGQVGAAAARKGHCACKGQEEKRTGILETPWEQTW